ncbi:unnamed protein product, partial [Rangifer tarandus platyrhynchus]
EGKKISWRAGPLVSSLWGLRGSCPGSPSLPIIITAPSSCARRSRKRLRREGIRTLSKLRTKS